MTRNLPGASRLPHISESHGFDPPVNLVSRDIDPHLVNTQTALSLKYRGKEDQYLNARSVVNCASPRSSIQSALAFISRKRRKRHNLLQLLPHQRVSISF